MQTTQLSNSLYFEPFFAQKPECFIHLDPLGIQMHPFVQKQMLLSLFMFGCDSPNLEGQKKKQQQIEAKLSCYLNKEKTLLFHQNDPWTFFIDLLFGKEATLLIDKSLVRPHTPWLAKVVPFDPKKQTSHLKEYLQNEKGALILTTPSDAADFEKIKSLGRLAKEAGWTVIGHEYGKIGTEGHYGFGKCAELPFIDWIYGGYGGNVTPHISWIAGKNSLESLLMKSKELFLSHFLPSPWLGFAESLINMIPFMHAERACIAKKKREWIDFFISKGYAAFADSGHQIRIISKTELPSLRARKYYNQTSKLFEIYLDLSIHTPHPSKQDFFKTK